MTTLSLHAQFDVIRLKLHLNKHPQDAYQLAIEHFQDYLEVVERYKKLEKKLKAPSLPPIPTPSHARLQKNYDELLESYAKVSAASLNLQEENEALVQLLEALTNEDFDLPPSVKERLVK